jgi:hypothetical protein
MDPIRSITRRSFLGRITGGAAAIGSLVTLTGCTTLANTDSDPYDPIGGGYGGHGRGGGGHRRRRRRDREEGGSDRDSGRYADPPGRGRGD